MEVYAICCLLQTSSSDSAWAGVFARSAMSSVQSASVIVWTGYLLLIAFCCVKTFSFIKSINIRRYGAKISPCRTPATMSKKLLSQSGERTFLPCFYGASLWLWRFLWEDHRLEVFASSSRCVWSQMPLRNLQIRMLPRGFFGGSLKLVDKFTYLGSSVSSMQKDVNTWLAKAWTPNDRLSVIWKSD